MPSEPRPARHAWKRAALAVVVLVAVLSAPRRADASSGETLYFPHRDDEYLREDQRNGGAVFLPAAAAPLRTETARGEPPRSEPLRPLVVFLHGVNPAGRLHLGLADGPADLRPLVSSLVDEGTTEPFVFAAPSQTREASRGRALWSGFDLERFVDDVAALVAGRVRIDRGRVIVVGHSGAGCNVRGGVLSAVATYTHPTTLVAVDTCMDRISAAGFARVPRETSLWVLWQPYTWARDFEAFRRVVLRGREGGWTFFDRLIGPAANAHEIIVPASLSRVLPRLLPVPAPAPGLADVPPS